MLLSLSREWTKLRLETAVKELMEKDSCSGGNTDKLQRILGDA